jgi:thiol-disulfide isomerase/thioredoxin
MIGNYDIKFEITIAHDAPAFLVDPTKGFEAQASVHNQLLALKGAHTKALGNAVRSAANGLGGGSSARQAGTAQPAEARRHLPVHARAPEFTDTQHWFNTPGDKPIKLASLRGKVVVDFWTYSCINCIRTLPYVKSWYATYHPCGLEIIGVHTPEFSFEQGADVRGASVSPSVERLYTLVSLPSVQRHTLTLEPQAGTRLYEFTFG